MSVASQKYFTIVSLVISDGRVDGIETNIAVGEQAFRDLAKSQMWDTVLDLDRMSVAQIAGAVIDATHAHAKTDTALFGRVRYATDTMSGWISVVICDNATVVERTGIRMSVHHMCVRERPAVRRLARAGYSQSEMRKIEESFPLERRVRESDPGIWKS